LANKNDDDVDDDDDDDDVFDELRENTLNRIEMANATTAKNFLVMKQNAKSEMTENETLWNQTRRVSSSRSDVKSMAGVQRPDDLLDNQGASCRVAGQWSTASRCSDPRRFSQIGLHRIVSHRPATLLRPIPCSRVVSDRVRSGRVAERRPSRRKEISLFTSKRRSLIRVLIDD
jgi:hypothetical protein